MSCLSDFWLEQYSKTLQPPRKLLMSKQTRAGNPPCDIALTQSRDFVNTDLNNSFNFVKNNRIQQQIKPWSWRPFNLCSTSSGDLLDIIINDQKKQAKVVQCTYCLPCRKTKYCKCITFGDVFFLAPLAVVSIRQIKYIAKCAST